MKFDFSLAVFPLLLILALTAATGPASAQLSELKGDIQEAPAKFISIAEWMHAVIEHVVYAISPVPIVPWIITGFIIIGTPIIIIASLKSAAKHIAIGIVVVIALSAAVVYFVPMLPARITFPAS